VVFTDKMAEMGYNRSQVIQAVNENHCSDLSATYMLLKLQLTQVLGEIVVVICTRDL